MEEQTFYMRKMLRQYGQQLITARRLARYQHAFGSGVSLSEREASMHRSLMVERIAKEITENLIFSGSENIIVLEVMNELNKELREEFTFKYPPGSLQFIIYKNKNNQLIEVSGEERDLVIETLWQIALRVVDKSMI